jgi:hypothetical protein
MFPNGAAVQILCQTIDLCTKSLMRATFGNKRRYKSHSARKSLILNALLHGSFSTPLFQAFDFAGDLGGHRPAINKVIHRTHLAQIKFF